MLQLRRLTQRRPSRTKRHYAVDYEGVLSSTEAALFRCRWFGEADREDPGSSLERDPEVMRFLNVRPAHPRRRRKGQAAEFSTPRGGGNDVWACCRKIALRRLCGMRSLALSVRARASGNSATGSVATPGVEAWPPRARARWAAIGISRTMTSHGLSPQPWRSTARPERRADGK